MNNGKPFREKPQKTDFDAVKIYRLRIVGHLDLQWKDWLGGLNISLDENGYTLIDILIVDQAALHGLLKKIRNAGMTLDSVVCVKPVGLTANFSNREI